MKKRLIQFLILLTIAFVSTEIAIAQTNYASIKVDELSDAKIRELMQRAELRSNLVG